MSDEPKATRADEPVSLECPFCHVPLVGGPAWCDCPRCKTFSRHIVVRTSDTEVADAILRISYEPRYDLPVMDTP